MANQTPPLLSLYEVSRLLNIPAGRIMKAINAGTVSFTPGPNGTRLFRQEALDEVRAAVEAACLKKEGTAAS